MMAISTLKECTLMCLISLLIWANEVSFSMGNDEPSRKSPFADLSTEEMNDVMFYMRLQDDLDIVSVEWAKPNNAYIYMIEALRPNKSEALQYLDASGPLPQRAARVILFRGNLPKPIIQEYKVFPIPNPTNHQLIINPKWRNPIPFTSRPSLSNPETKEYKAFVEKEVAKVNDILFEATGYTYYLNCTTRCLNLWSTIPPLAEADHHTIMYRFLKNIEGSELHPIGFQFLLNMDSVDSKDWSVEYVWFQGQSFRDFDHLLEAKSMNRLKISKVPDPYGMGTTNLSSSLNFRGEPRPEKPASGPRSYMPNGNRFTVSDRRIKWLGWEFEFSMLSSSGIQLHDVKFLNERIAYELSLQEIGVFYSGGSPAPKHTTYYDSFTNIGLQTSELFTGIDCPYHANFFDFIHYTHGLPVIYKNGACVFEHDLGLPLRRHFVRDKMSHGMPNNVLVFRHILAVDNYDYIIDFTFYQGGQIEGKVTLTGYVLNSFYTGPEMNENGYVINVPSTIGDIHHHVVNLKADLDIKGKKNRFHTLDIALQEEIDLLNNGYLIYNRIFKRDLKRTETEAAYQFNFDTPKYLVISNENSTNKFGYPRGYRILSEGMSKMLLPDDYRGARSRSWTKYQVAVTKQKDYERSSSSVYATLEPFDPVMSFQDFIDDDENIVDEDLVAWITLGTHHIPHSEDVPIVSTPGVQLKFFLLPYNYFDEDPSLASRDNIRTTPDGKGGHNYQYSSIRVEEVAASVGNFNTCSKLYLVLLVVSMWRMY